MVVKVQVKVFWVVMAYSVMLRYQHFGGPCCLQLLCVDGDSKVLQINGILPWHHTMSQPRCIS